MRLHRKRARISHWQIIYIALLDEIITVQISPHDCRPLGIVRLSQYKQSEAADSQFQEMMVTGLLKNIAEVACQ